MLVNISLKVHSLAKQHGLYVEEAKQVEDPFNLVLITMPTEWMSINARPQDVVLFLYMLYMKILILIHVNNPPSLLSHVHVCMSIGSCSSARPFLLYNH